MCSVSQNREVVKEMEDGMANGELVAVIFSSLLYLLPFALA